MVKVLIDSDRLEIAVDGGTAHQVTEEALAAILLLGLGYSADALSAWLDDAEAALKLLRSAGLDTDQDVEITAPGLTMFPHTVPATDRILAGQLAKRAARDPDGIALVLDAGADQPAIEVTAQDLLDLVSDVADRFGGEGLAAGDHIAVSATPSFENIVLLQAAWEVGISVSLIRDTATESLIKTVAAALDPKLWFLSDAVAAPEGAQVIRLSGAGSSGFDDWLDGGASKPLPQCTLPDTEAVVMLSSGSTGEPKLLSLTQRGLFHSAHLALQSAPHSDQPRHASSTDLTAMSGLRCLPVLPLLSDHAAVVLEEGAIDSSLGILETFGRLNVTHAQVIPRSLRAAIELGRPRLESMGLGSLALIASGTGVLHGVVRQRTREVFQCVLRDHFGVNESTGVFGWNSEGTVSEEGTPVFNTLVRICKSDGSPCEIGETGHVRIFNEGLYNGQYTRDGFVPRARGWFTAGDLGVRQEDGTIRIVGRTHDLIKTQEGEFISPIAIESAALAVTSVQEAVVVTLPATIRGEAFALVLEAAGIDEGGLRMAVASAIDASVGPYAVPDKISILENLPRAANGKPDRARLVSMLAENG